MPSGSIVTFSTLNDGTTNVYGFQVIPGHGTVYNTSDEHRIWLANFDVFGTPYYTQTEGYLESLPNENAIASECALWMCVQAFKTNTINTNQIQTIVQTFSQVINSSDPGMFNLTDYYVFSTLPAEMNPRPQASYTVDISAKTEFSNSLSMFNGSLLF